VAADFRVADALQDRMDGLLEPGRFDDGPSCSERRYSVTLAVT
jgi:hypothetical protein